MKALRPTIKMTMIKKYAIILALFYPLYLFGQQKDFGIWYDIGLEKKITKKIDVNFNGVLRTYGNASQTDQFYLESGLSYKVNKYISAALNYRWIYKHEEGPVFYSRHRWFTDVKLSYPLNRLKFSARFRYQNQYKSNYENDKDKIAEHYGRIKATCFYNVPAFPVNPYISLEYFYPLFNKEKTFADKKRSAIGIEYGLNKKNTVNLEYIFQRDYLPQLSDIHIISVNYQFSF
jgi:hypothetical protein